MANPFSRGSLTTFPSSGNLVAMASGFALGLGAVSGVVAGAPYADIIVAPVQVKTGSVSGVSAYLNLYAACSEDNTVWDGTISPAATGNQSSVVGLTKLVQTLPTPASGTIYAFNEFSIWSTFGFIPSFFTILVQNNTLSALDVTGSNFVAKYALDSYT